ncbi:MAG TPA: DUF6587 family protein [Burkholderiaceae bacterium]|jgi:hypothetical protein|nr:DUF6587 family protein [Burkholderiaceae bacterium]
MIDNAMQNVVVMLIVLAAAGYAAWRLAPAALRHALAARSGSLARAGGASETLARRIEIKASEVAANAGGCGSCGPCKACATGRDAEAAD